MTESQRMLEILHENKKKIREEKLNKKKESKLDTVLSYVILGIATTIFAFGIMALIAVIENMPL